ncbi:MAG: hypothetical protein RR185_02220 [Angelakisella sp.]
MTCVTIAGENAAQLCAGIAAILSPLCQVATACDGQLLLQGGTPDVFLWHSKGDIFVEAPRSLLVFAEPARRAERVEVPGDCVIIADLADEAAASYAVRRGLRLLDCGLSSKATLTFSSIGQDTEVVSLQRSITDAAGRRIEPLDIPLSIKRGPYYPMLAAVGILLLSGVSDRMLRPISR